VIYKLLLVLSVAAAPWQSNTWRVAGRFFREKTVPPKFCTFNS